MSGMPSPPAPVPAPEIEVIACHACGQVHRLPPMRDRTTAACERCGAMLRKRVVRSIDRSLAAYLGAFILFYVANAYPIMTFAMEGREQSSTILDAARALVREDMAPLGLIVLMAGTVLPLVKIVGSLCVLLPLRFGQPVRHLGAAFRWLERLRPWSMMEVYLLGLIVAYVKLTDIATVELGVAIGAFAALIVVMLAADANLDPHAVWDRIAPQAGPEILHARPGADLVSCEHCGQLQHLPFGATRMACGRCGGGVHRRKPASLSRCWALVLTAAILYLPANLYPIMTVTSFGWTQASTILSGIEELFAAGMAPIAVLVLFASILVPLLKLFGLTGLLLSVHRGSTWRPRDRTFLYRIIEGVGRWSMIDIFMIAILTALVRLDKIASVEPNIGAVAFALVVILTMLASTAFDPRLIWDVADERSGQPAALRV